MRDLRSKGTSKLGINVWASLVEAEGKVNSKSWGGRVRESVGVIEKNWDGLLDSCIWMSLENAKVQRQGDESFMGNKAISNLTSKCFKTWIHNHTPWEQTSLLYMLCERKMMQEVMFVVTEVYRLNESWIYIIWFWSRWFKNQFSSCQNWMATEVESWRQGVRPIFWRKFRDDLILKDQIDIVCSQCRDPSKNNSKGKHRWLTIFA